MTSVGFVVLGAVFVLIGWLAFRISQGGYSEEASNSGALVIWVAASHAPEKAGGLDAALHTIGAQPFGQVLPIMTAIGLLCFGGYSIARARSGDAG